jgi:hypothetical protein
VDSMQLKRGSSIHTASHSRRAEVWVFKTGRCPTTLRLFSEAASVQGKLFPRPPFSQTSFPQPNKHRMQHPSVCTMHMARPSVSCTASGMGCVGRLSCAIARSRSRHPPEQRQGHSRVAPNSQSPHTARKPPHSCPSHRCRPGQALRPLMHTVHHPGCIAAVCGSSPRMHDTGAAPVHMF